MNGRKNRRQPRCVVATRAQPPCLTVQCRWPAGGGRRSRSRLCSVRTKLSGREETSRTEKTQAYIRTTGRSGAHFRSTLLASSSPPGILIAARSNAGGSAAASFPAARRRPRPEEPPHGPPVHYPKQLLSRRARLLLRCWPERRRPRPPRRSVAERSPISLAFLLSHLFSRHW